MLEGLARIPVEVDLASEFRYRDPILEEGAMVIVISQSGEVHMIRAQPDHFMVIHIIDFSRIL